MGLSSEAKMVPVALVGLRVCLVMSEEPRVAVRPRFLRASRGCVVVCVYEYEIILTTSGPYFRKYFREKGSVRPETVSGNMGMDHHAPEILIWAKSQGMAGWYSHNNMFFNAFNDN